MADGPGNCKSVERAHLERLEELQPERRKLWVEILQMVLRHQCDIADASGPSADHIADIWLEQFDKRFTHPDLTQRGE